MSAVDDVAPEIALAPCLVSVALEEGMTNVPDFCDIDDSSRSDIKVPRLVEKE